ncbi:MAG: hypothetical protein PG981_000782 [Wolbachia endosymbiont of Ctenocephalides orientis wCori]|nr:MAG: hypothetical protein PG981_000782 [Wolbachia endosymbiont of Ctenocephalides orientis wCori]
MFNDHGKLLPNVQNMLDTLLCNDGGLTAQKIFLQLHNEVSAKEEKLAREKRQAEEELNKKNEVLKDLIQKGDIKLLKVIKGEDIGDKRSKVIFTQGEEGDNIILDPSKFYIAQYEGHEFLHFVESYGYETLLHYDDLFFVLNENSYTEFNSGFYPIYKSDGDNYVRYLNDKNQLFDGSPDLVEYVIAELQTDSEAIADKKHTGFETPVDSPKEHEVHPVEEIREEIVAGSVAKSRTKRTADEDDYYSASQDTDTQVRDATPAVEYQKNFVSQELIQRLFPNKQDVVINDKLTVEVK